LILGGILLRLGILWHYNPVDHIWSDPQRHWEQGIDALRADPQSITDPIMFQLYIGILAKLTLKNALLVFFYTSLLSLLTPYVWYRFFRELQPNKAIALAGWAVAAWLPSWISIYSYFMNETLLLPLLGGALCATWRARRKQTVASFVLMIFLWTVTGLTRGVCIPMAAVACVWVWAGFPHKFRTAFYSLLILALILGPLTYRNYQVMHILAPHGISHMVAIYAASGKKEIKITYNHDGAIWYYGFMSPSLLIEPFRPLSDWKTQREGTVEVFIDINQGAISWSKAKALWKPDVKRFLWITKENLIFLFFGPSWPDANRARLLDEINYQMRWTWVPLTLVVCVWTGLVWRKSKIDLLLPSLILVWFIVQGLLSISVNEGRYRKPFEGLLLAQVVLVFGSSRRNLRGHI
jgi:hypothetical protein